MTEEIKKIEDNCKIKSKEQFIEECEKAGISSDWYSFTYDKTKPVCIDGNSVYYGIAGVTNHSVLMTIWDTAFKKLQSYKKEYEWEISGAGYRITAIDITESEYIANRKQDYQYPDILITKSIPDNKPSQTMLDDGWIDGGYDYYMGYYNYSKVVDIRTVLDKIGICFKKKTDKRDVQEFGFSEEYLLGSYTYDIPSDMLEEIAKEVHSVLNVKKDILAPRPISNELKDKIIQRLATNILEDEFQALLRLRDEHKNALFNAIDKSLFEKEQKNAFAKASRVVEKNNPATQNVMGSRSYLIMSNNFDLVYDVADIPRKMRFNTRNDIKSINDRMGNKNEPR